MSDIAPTLTVTEFMRKLDTFVREIGCTGTGTGSHTYPSTVEFWDRDGNAYRIVDIEPRTHLGCGCWTGIEFRLERVDKWSVNDG